MVNLLFISNYAMLDSIKSELQPLLKVKIDIVGDFDYGLKDVFEKRPATVFIQDQIAGVTGESVARHIQMLLGTEAPSFIYLHEGNSKAKPVKGLYEYLIDFSQPDTKVMRDIQATLKSLLGSQWQKIYLPSKSNKSDVIAVKSVPESPRIVNDQLVDNLLLDTENADTVKQNDFNPLSDFNPLNDFIVKETSKEEPFMVFSSPHDQLEEVVAEIARHKIETESSTGVNFFEEDQTDSSAELSVNPPHQGEETALPEPTIPVVCEKESVLDSLQVTPTVTTPVVPAALTSSVSVTAPTIINLSKKSNSKPNSLADFRIEKESQPADAFPDELLRVFDENNRKTLGWRRCIGIAVVLIMCIAGGGWYLVKQKPHLLSFSAKPSPEAVMTIPAVSSPVLQKPEPTPQNPDVQPLPSFIPLAGHDRSFASVKPGWERYVGTSYEFRVFRLAGKLKAVQILAAKGHEISDTMLKAILTELVEAGDYRVTSREHKLGFQVLHATANRKADLLIYRKKSGVQAVVISLD